MLTGARDARGFTLMELSVAVAVLGILMSAVTALMVITLQRTAAADRELTETADLQFAAAYFPHDVEGASEISSGTAAKCGPGNVVIEFVGTDYSAGLEQVTNVVSYASVSSGERTSKGTELLELHRITCTASGTGPAYPLEVPEGGDSIVADELDAASPPVTTCYRASGAEVPCTAASVRRVELLLTEASGQQFTLVGRPRTQ